ncbi:MAG: acetylornithine transaminase [Bowdeniella nasicola]|nr:acetylornithine transaminase [Bowdeniella nasicola]
MTWLATYENDLQGVFGTPLRQLVSGHGCVVHDEQGNEYLDLLGGIAVTCLGQGHRELADAIHNQMLTLGHVSNFFTTPPQLALAAKLREYVPSAKVFFANSGAEANEAALKLARRHRPGGNFVALNGAFHGRTMGALSLTAKERYRTPFEPMLEDVTFVEPEDDQALIAAVSDKTSALIVEPIQGERGVMELSDEFLQVARRRTAEVGALLIVDEIQTGSGRTGEFLAHTKAGITPDVITIAKGLGGGFPIGAMLALDGAASVLGPGDHGTTFGGNPVACRAALTVLEIIERDNLLTRVREVGAAWKDELAAVPGVRQVRGRGLLLGIVVDDAPAIQRALLEAGFITNAPNPDTLRIAPSYLISDDQRASFTAGLSKVLAGQR